MTDTTRFRALFDDLLTRVEGREPEWLTARRRASFDHVERLGFPTTRAEDWRYTNLAPLDAALVALPNGNGNPDALRDAISHSVIDGLTVRTLVFVNGAFSPALSSLGSLSNGVTAQPLSSAWEKHEDLVRAHLGTLLNEDEYVFQALNGAFMADGLFLRVAAGVTSDDLLHVVHVSSGDGAFVAPRGLILVEAGARATVIETFVGTGQAATLTNPAMEISVGRGAELNYLRFAREPEQALHFAATAVHQDSETSVNALHVSLGGRLVRNDIFHTLAGADSQSTVNGLYYLTGEQQTDNFTRVRHLAEGGRSRQIFKGILADRSHGVFDGRIYVAKGAQRTDAVQTNRNLLLSNDAVTNAKPQLEIYADDVKCTHAATTGQLADEQLFYLRSRGFSLAKAKALLTYAFAGALIDEITLEPVRNRLEQELMILTA